MTREELSRWAAANGWQMIAGHLSLTKRSAPKEAVVRLVFKATVVHLEVKKPAGKWEKFTGQSYGDIEADPENGLPLGLGFERMPAFSTLMRENKDRTMLAGMGAPTV